MAKLGAKRGRTAPKGNPTLTPDELKGLIEQTLDEAKAEDIVSVSLAGKSTVADYMIVASGMSYRQVAALAERVAEAVRQAGHVVLSIEGLKASDWVLVDAGDIIVHLFRPEVRAFYGLEKMWSVDLSSRRAKREPGV